MPIKIAVMVEGLDLLADETVEVLAGSLDDLAWSSVNGRTTFTLVVDDGLDPVCAACEASNRVSNALPQAKVARVDRDLVSAADIAERVGVARETVRTWARGKRGAGDFPTPAGTVGGGERGGTDVWCWGDVAQWLKSSRRYPLEFEVLTSEQIAAIDAHIARIPQPIDERWKSVQKLEPVSFDVVLLEGVFTTQSKWSPAPLLVHTGGVGGWTKLLTEADVL